MKQLLIILLISLFGPLIKADDLASPVMFTFTMNWNGSTDTFYIKTALYQYPETNKEQKEELLELMQFNNQITIFGKYFQRKVKEDNLNCFGAIHLLSEKIVLNTDPDQLPFLDIRVIQAKQFCYDAPFFELTPVEWEIWKYNDIEAYPNHASDGICITSVYFLSSNPHKRTIESLLKEIANIEDMVHQEGHALFNEKMGLVYSLGALTYSMCAC